MKKLVVIGNGMAGVACVEQIRKETVYAAEPIKEALLRRLRKSKALARDAWLEREEPVHPTQFVQIQPMETVLA